MGAGEVVGHCERRWAAIIKIVILAEVFHSPAWRSGGDDTTEAGGERDGGARGRAVDGDVLPG